MVYHSTKHHLEKQQAQEYKKLEDRQDPLYNLML
jgi:hypothetical protein